eukprot:7692509-Lingulodinium_polyedra.AAC.1
MGLREAVRLRITRPQLGEDTLWVARTYGEADPAAVEAVVERLIQGRVYATAAPLYNAHSRADEPGILLRVESARRDEMANLVAAGSSVRVQGRQHTLQPFIAMGR